MSEQPPKKMPDLKGLDPTKTFYMGVWVSNLDGSTDIECVESASHDEAEALNALIELNEEYPTADGYLYRCIPIARVWRGKPKVTRLAK